jgi:hypothetical protein
MRGFWLNTIGVFLACIFSLASVQMIAGAMVEDPPIVVAKCWDRSVCNSDCSGWSGDCYGGCDTSGRSCDGCKCKGDPEDSNNCHCLLEADDILP